MNRYHQFATYLRLRLRQRVQKIPLDAGFTCPNRDGTFSTKGCIFCNPNGSGSGMGLEGVSIKDQWAFWREHFSHSHGSALFIAYLQSFSNTYGPLEKLEQTLDSLEALPDLAGLSIGTRPDCVDEAKLTSIARFSTRPGIREVWIEFGLQSAHDVTLQRINRGHDFATFQTAVHMANNLGLNVCAHIIAGLPGESKADFLATVDLVNALPVRGIKFHCLYVAKNTPLAREWQENHYTPLTEEEYIDAIVTALPRLRPELIIQRLVGDPAEGELLAPLWTGTKGDMLAAIARELEKKDTWQGKELSTNQVTRPPLWFTLRQNLPRALYGQWRKEFRTIAEALHFDTTEPLS